MTYIIPTQFASHIAKNLEERGHEIIHPLKNRDGKFYHPDGTFYTRIPEAEGLREALVLHSGAPRPNDGVVELDFILGILQRNSVKFDVFMLYYPYGRQDHIRDPGETVYAEDLAKSIFSRGAGKIYVIDAHFSEQDWVSKYPIENVSADSLIRESVNDPDSVFIAPDVGAGKRFGTANMYKTREDSSNVKISSLDDLAETVKDKHVVIRDDIISTGGTMIAAKDNLLRLGVRRVSAAATHGLMEEGLNSVYNKFEGNLHVTNTISSRYSNVDMTPLILKR